eukprot:m.175217 g.175217  ORF g.175217 m.175217 type:complete len:278 (+) comp24399_c0_seq4:48-881(+)
MTSMSGGNMRVLLMATAVGWLAVASDSIRVIEPSQHAGGTLRPGTGHSGSDIVEVYNKALSGTTTSDTTPSIPLGSSTPTPTPRSSWVENGRVVVEGKVVFPLGTYVHDLNDSEWDYLAAAGYDHVLTYTNGHIDVSYNTSGWATTQAFLDAAASRKMRVILSLKDYYNETRYPDINAFVNATVIRFRNHKGLLGWYLNDEYRSDMIPTLRARYDLVKAADPGHFTYSVEDSSMLGDLPLFRGTSDVTLPVHCLTCLPTCRKLLQDYFQQSLCPTEH